MSKLEKLGDKTLKLILETLYKEFHDEELDLERLEDVINNSSLVDSVVKYFGVENLDRLDYTFICELAYRNLFVDEDEIEINIPLKRPSLKKFRVYHKEFETVHRVNYYASTLNSYCNIGKEEMQAMESNDLFNYYNGNIYNREEYSWDTEDTEIDDIEEM